MDYDKIGKFISDKRKECNLTQLELGDKLGLTDRAISRWERGKGCPDISLLEPLSKVLNVSVVELLHGEEVKDSQNAFVQILVKERKKINKWKFISYVFINVLFVLFLVMFLFSYLIPKYVDSHDDIDMISMVSPSMNPTLDVYDLVFVKKVNIEDVKVGDVVYYEKDGNPIIHRVVDIQSGGIAASTYSNKEIINSVSNVCLMTKGDANVDVDNECVYEKNFVGVVSYHIPIIGKFFMDGNNSLEVFGLFLLLGILSIFYLDGLLVKSYVQKHFN